MNHPKEAHGDAVTVPSYAYRAGMFRLRVAALAIPMILGMGYQRWIAPLLGSGYEKRSRHAIPQAISAGFLRLNGIQPELEGAEHLAATAGQGRLLMLNHNSRFDGYILMALMDTHYKAFWSNTAHITTEGFGLVSAFGRVFDLFFVHDKSDKRLTLSEFRCAERYVARGETLSVFPEGSFSNDGDIHGFGSSCIGLALRAHAVIVPVVMVNSEITFERLSKQDGPKVVRLRVLPPVSTEGLERRDIARVTAELENLMGTQLREMRGENDQ
ncbi:MAG: 1-acyl-sn-glycerol-3-phosphate acyltransferase [Ketobacter sp.]|nr:1-acyl-sn-glycerol-3-phosphate acyltransferase [Ketobacter sp.]